MMKTAVAVFLSLLFPAFAAGRSKLVPVAGSVFAVVVDRTGQFAYVSNDALLGVFDLGARTLVQTHALPTANRVVDVDPTTGRVALFGFDGVETYDPYSGLVDLVKTGFGSAFTGAAFAAGRLYVASFNKRVVYSIALDGGPERSITPYPEGTESNGGVAGPCTVTASADGTTILMGDEFHAAVHTIRTADDTVVASNAVGFAPCTVFFRSAASAVAIGAGAETTPGVGQIALVDLSAASSVPQLIRVPGFKRVSAATYVPGRDVVLLLHGGRDTRNSIEEPSKLARGDRVQLAAVDLTRRRVRRRWSLGRRIGVGWDLAVSPDGRTLVIGSSKGVYVADLKL
jgi:hypothetical protein